MPASPRKLAALVLAQVFTSGSSLDQALAENSLAQVPTADRALLRELCFGTLRWLPRLSAVLDRLLKRPLKQRDADIEALLLLGLYQLIALRIPDHAAVAESVNTARALGKSWAVGLVNAVLRNCQRNAAALLAAVDGDPVAHHAHSAWWLERLQSDWPEHWEALTEANNQRPPMCLRVNCRRAERVALQAELEHAGLGAEPHPYAEDALMLASPVDVDRLPGFAAGKVSVQDAAAQLAAPLLELAPGMRFLDACAAPGGKLCHALERQPELAEVVGLDVDDNRLLRIQENLDRLELQATLMRADAVQTDSWWDGRQFERILLDAPCSGSGVIRRHPDIKLRRTTAQVASSRALQANLLNALWPLLVPGGKLLYVTCSVLVEENAGCIADFLKSRDDARPEVLDVPWGVASGPGRQVLTGEKNMDGFYYARLVKRGS